MSDPRLSRASAEIKEAISEAEAKEESIRDYAMLGLGVELCGVECKQFTPRHFAILNGVRNAYVTGGHRTAEQTGIFLWVVSDGFSETDMAARDSFIARVGAMPGAVTFPAQIEEYIADAWVDSPRGSNSNASPITSFSASLVHRLAASYGWSVDYIMGLPFGMVFQLLRRIALDDNPKATFGNAYSDKAKANLAKCLST